MEHFFSSKLNQRITALTLGAAGIALLAYAFLTVQMAGTYPMPATVSVTGTGEVQVVPDVGQFTFSVMAEGATAAEVQEASAQKINEIIEFMKSQGVEEKDIKTQDYSLSPRYRFDQQPCAFGMMCPPGEQVQDGFTVSQSIEVKVRDVAKSGELIAGAGERGATNMSNLTFVVDDIEKVKAEAREKAVADARAKADKLASDLGVEIVRLTGFWEQEAPSSGPYAERAMTMDMAVGSEAMVPPQLPTGENTTTVQVQLTYEIK